MAVGKDIGDYAARMRAATEQADGFAFAGPQVSWNAPRPDILTADERAQRRETQRTIDKGLNDIDAALVSPNLSESQRAELATQKSLLEGMRMQLATGARSGADVGQISAMVANVAANVSATTATVSSGGGSGGPIALARAQAEYQRAATESRNWLRDTSPAFEQRSREAFSMAHKYGIDVSDEEESLRDARKREKEAAAKGDVAGQLGARIQGLDAQVGIYDKVIDNPSTSDADRKRAEEQRSKALEEREKAVQKRQELEEKKRAEDEQKIKNDPNLSQEQKDIAMKRIAQERAAVERNRNLEQSEARKDLMVYDIRRDVDVQNFRAREAAAVSTGISKVLSLAGSGDSPYSKLSSAFMLDKARTEAFGLTKSFIVLAENEVDSLQKDLAPKAVAEGNQSVDVQQVAKSQQTQEAAKPLAEQKAESAATDNNAKTAQPTRVASATSDAEKTRG